MLRKSDRLAGRSPSHAQESKKPKPKSSINLPNKKSVFDEFQFHCPDRSSDIYFQKVTEEVMNVWANHLEVKYTGPILDCQDVHIVTRNKMERDTLFTPQEVKKLQPTELMLDMYAVDNRSAKSCEERLDRKYGRVMSPVPVSADSLLNAILMQVSHGVHKFKAEELRHQMAYYMLRWPEVFEPMMKKAELLEEHSYLSFAMNLYYGKIYMCRELAGVIVKMWNLPIDLVNGRYSRHLFHNSKQAPVVIVHNELQADDSQFTGTRLPGQNWRPYTGPHWSQQIMLCKSVKYATDNAQKRLQERKTNELMKAYEEVDILLLKNNSLLNTVQSKIKELDKEAKAIESDIALLSGRQGMIRMKLIEMGAILKDSSQQRVIGDVQLTPALPPHPGPEVLPAHVIVTSEIDVHHPNAGVDSSNRRNTKPTSTSQNPDVLDYNTVMRQFREAEEQLSGVNVTTDKENEANVIPPKKRKVIESNESPIKRKKPDQSTPVVDTGVNTGRTVDGDIVPDEPTPSVETGVDTKRAVVEKTTPAVETGVNAGRVVVDETTPVVERGDDAGHTRQEEKTTITESDNDVRVSYVEVTPLGSTPLPSFLSPTAVETPVTTVESLTPKDGKESSQPSNIETDAEVVFEFSTPRNIAPLPEMHERPFSEWNAPDPVITIDDENGNGSRSQRVNVPTTVTDRSQRVNVPTPVTGTSQQRNVPTTVTTVQTPFLQMTMPIPVRGTTTPVTSSGEITPRYVQNIPQIEATLRPAIPPQPGVVSATPAAPSKNYSNPMWGQTTSGQLISVRWNRKLRGNYSCWCPKCNNPFTQRNDLKRHLESNCSLIPAAQKVRYMCEVPGCTKDFSTKQYRNEHLHQDHLKKFLYVCSVCNKGFYKHVNFHHHKNSCLGALQQK